MNYDSIIKYFDTNNIAYYEYDSNIFTIAKHYLITITFDYDKNIKFVTFSINNNPLLNKHFHLLLNLKANNLKLSNIAEMLNMDIKTFIDNSVQNNIDHNNYYSNKSYDNLINFIKLRKVPCDIFSKNSNNNVFIKMDNNCIFEISYYNNGELNYYCIHNMEYSILNVNKLTHNYSLYKNEKINIQSTELLHMKDVFNIIFKE